MLEYLIHYDAYDEEVCPYCGEKNHLTIVEGEIE
jgi:hypothetical protein